jgi:hypothetical protein
VRSQPQSGVTVICSVPNNLIQEATAPVGRGS